VVPCADTADIKLQQFDFCPIGELEKVEKDAFIDVLGVVTAIGNVTEINTKAGKTLARRPITLCDQTGKAVPNHHLISHYCLLGLTTLVCGCVSGGADTLGSGRAVQ
jgi:hypothetical protein